MKALLFVFISAPLVFCKNQHQEGREENETQKVKVAKVFSHMLSISRDLEEVKGELKEIERDVREMKKENSAIYALLKAGLLADLVEEDGKNGTFRSLDVGYGNGRRCPEGFALTRHRSCYLVVYEQTNWPEARDACRQFGADLVAIETEGEQHFLKGQINNGVRHCDFWTSGSDVIKEGTWSWHSNGKPLRYTHWHRNEPNNGNNSEHCLWLDWYFAWRWNDADCQRDRACYICEAPKKRSL